MTTKKADAAVEWRDDVTVGEHVFRLHDGKRLEYTFNDANDEAFWSDDFDTPFEEATQVGYDGEWWYWVDEAYGHGIRIELTSGRLQYVPVSWAKGQGGTCLGTNHLVMSLSDVLWTEVS